MLSYLSFNILTTIDWIEIPVLLNFDDIGYVRNTIICPFVKNVFGTFLTKYVQNILYNISDSLSCS